MSVSTKSTTFPKSTKSRNSDYTLKFEILDLVDFGGVGFSVESVIGHDVELYAPASKANKYRMAGNLQQYSPIITKEPYS